MKTAKDFDKNLAKITGASLEIKSRGMLNFWIYVDYEDGCSQGVGGIFLDSYDKEKKERVGTAYGCEMIRQMLLTLGVDDFSEMKGKYVWVLCEGEGLSSSPKGFETLRVDGEVKSIIFDNIYEESKEREKERETTLESLATKKGYNDLMVDAKQMWKDKDNKANENREEKE